MTNELSHHGIKGMKWGVRRYQNYDGTYTKKGLLRYKKAESKYEKAVGDRDDVKESYKLGAATKEQKKEAANLVKKTRKDLNESYTSLQQDYLADEGKKLYQEGKTITGNKTRSFVGQTAILAGTIVVNNIIKTAFGDTLVTRVATRTIAMGGTVANTIIAGNTMINNKKLRAYYGHK